MSNVITSRSYLDFPVAAANTITTANTWLLTQDNLPNSNGGIGNTYRANSPILTSSNPVVFPSYTMATVPAANLFLHGVCFISNTAGATLLCYSNGTSWLVVSNNTIIT